MFWSTQGHQSVKYGNCHWIWCQEFDA